MTKTIKISLLLLLTTIIIVFVFSLDHIPQSAAYHHFCDDRSFLDIPNFANVVSNLPFLLAGGFGLLLLKRKNTERRIRIMYSFVFWGIILTAVGSGFYHWSPSNSSLVWDRLPMTIVFMSLVAAVIGEAIDTTAGLLLLPLLLALGAGSVLWWRYTESIGNGDLRLYVLTQYYPPLLISCILLLFPSAAIQRGWTPLLLAMGLYAFAKVLEGFDCSIYSRLGFISGHSLKHLLAGLSTCYLVLRFYRVHASDASAL